MPVGAQPIISDPTMLVETDDDALDMASLLMKVGSTGAGSGKESGDSAFWQTLAAAPLAAILQAAKANGKGILWAQQACGRAEGNDPEDTETPSWQAAYAVAGDFSRHAEDLFSVSQLEEKMKSSIMITMQAGLAPWLRSTVAGGPDAVPFTPQMLHDPNATVYMISPASGVAAGAATSVVDTVIKHWRRNFKHLPVVQITIDEMANSAPLPSLATYVTEARGLGVRLCCAVQSTSQLKTRYGADGCEILRDVFPAILVMTGAAEKEILERSLWWEGQAEQVVTSVNHLGQETQSREMRAAMEVSELLPKDIDHARLIRRGKVGEMVELVDISQLI